MNKTINATWNIDKLEIEKIFGLDVLDDLELALKREISGTSYVLQGWTEVIIGRNWRTIPDDWCKQNIKGKYQCLGTVWYFKNKEDAAWFILRWG